MSLISQTSVTEQVVYPRSRRSLKRPEEEAHYYKAAERLRQTILQPHEDAVEGAQAALRRQLDQRDAEQKLRVDDLKFAVTAELGQNLKKLSGTAALTTELMSGYAELLCAYRVQLVDMLFTAVSIAGDDATGEEYGTIRRLSTLYKSWSS